MDESLDPNSEPAEDSAEPGWPVPTPEVMNAIRARTAAWLEPDQLAAAQ